MNVKPPQTIASTSARPYVRPKPIASAWAPFEPLLPLPLLGDEVGPPKPVMSAGLPPEVDASFPPVEALVEVAAAVEVVIVDVFTRTGFWAPQGLSVRQAV